MEDDASQPVGEASPDSSLVQVQSSEQRESSLETGNTHPQHGGVNAVQSGFQDSNLSPALHLLPAASRGEHNLTEYSLLQQSDTDFAPLRAYPDTSMASEKLPSPTQDRSVHPSESDSLSQHPLVDATIHSEEAADTTQSQQLSDEVTANLREELFSKDAGDETFFLNEDVAPQDLLKILQIEVGMRSSSGSAGSFPSETSSSPPPFIKVSYESKNTEQLPAEEVDDENVHVNITMGSRSTLPDESSEMLHRELLAETNSHKDKSETTPTGELFTPTPEVGVKTTEGFSATVEAPRKDSWSDNQTGIDGSYTGFLPQSQSTPGVFRAPPKSDVKLGNLSAIASDIESSHPPAGEVAPQEDASHTSEEVQALPSLNYKQKVDAWRANQTSEKRQLFDPTAIQRQSNVGPGKEVFDPLNRTLTQQSGSLHHVLSAPSGFSSMRGEDALGNAPSNKDDRQPSLPPVRRSSLPPRSLETVVTSDLRHQQPDKNKGPDSVTTPPSELSPKQYVNKPKAFSAVNLGQDNESTNRRKKPSVSSLSLPIIDEQIPFDIHHQPSAPIEPEISPTDPQTAVKPPSGGSQHKKELSRSHGSSVSLPITMDSLTSAGSAQKQPPQRKVAASLSALTDRSHFDDSARRFSKSDLLASVTSDLRHQQPDKNRGPDLAHDWASTTPPSDLSPKQYVNKPRKAFSAVNLGQDNESTNRRKKPSASSLSLPIIDEQIPFHNHHQPSAPIEPEISPTDPQTAVKPPSGGSQHKKELSRSHGSSVSLPITMDSLTSAGSAQKQPPQRKVAASLSALTDRSHFDDSARRFSKSDLLASITSDLRHQQSDKNKGPDLAHDWASTTPPSELSPKQYVNKPRKAFSAVNLGQDNDSTNWRKKPSASSLSLPIIDEQIPFDIHHQPSAPIEPEISPTDPQTAVKPPSGGSQHKKELSRSHGSSVSLPITMDSLTSAGSAQKQPPQRKVAASLSALTDRSHFDDSARRFSKSDLLASITSDLRHLQPDKNKGPDLAHDWASTTPPSDLSPKQYVNKPKAFSAVNLGQDNDSTNRRKKPSVSSLSLPIVDEQIPFDIHHQPSAPIEPEISPTDPQTAVKPPSGGSQHKKELSRSHGSSVSLPITMDSLTSAGSAQKQPPQRKVAASLSALTDRSHFDDSARRFSKSDLLASTSSDPRAPRSAESIAPKKTTQHPDQLAAARRAEPEGCSAAPPGGAARRPPAAPQPSPPTEEQQQSLSSESSEQEAASYGSSESSLSARVAELLQRESPDTVTSSSSSTDQEAKTADWAKLSGQQSEHLELDAEDRKRVEEIKRELLLKNPLTSLGSTETESSAASSIRDKRHQSARGHVTRLAQDHLHLTELSAHTAEHTQRLNRVSLTHKEFSLVFEPGRDAFGGQTEGRPPSSRGQRKETSRRSGGDPSADSPRSSGRRGRADSASSPSSLDEGVGSASPPEWRDIRETGRRRSPQRSELSGLLKKDERSGAARRHRPANRQAETTVPVLLPYKPRGSEELFYVPQKADLFHAEMSDTTVESSHTGSNDGVPPEFSSDVLGHLDPGLDRGISIRHAQGIYSKSLRTTGFIMHGPGNRAADTKPLDFPLPPTFSTAREVSTREQGTSPLHFSQQPNAGRAPHRDRRQTGNLDQLWQKFCDQWSAEEAHSSSADNASLLERLERLSRLIDGGRAADVQDEVHHAGDKRREERESSTLSAADEWEDTSTASVSTVDTPRLARLFGAQKVQRLKSGRGLGKPRGAVDRQREEKESRLRFIPPSHTSDQSVGSDSSSAVSSSTLKSDRSSFTSLSVQLVSTRVQTGFRKEPRRRTRDVGTTFPSPSDAPSFCMWRERKGQKNPSRSHAAHKHRRKRNPANVHHHGVSWFISAEDLESEARKENQSEEPRAHGPSTARFESTGRANRGRVPLGQRRAHNEGNRPHADKHGSEADPPDALVLVSLQEALQMQRPEFISRSKQRMKQLAVQAEERKLQMALNKARGIFSDQPGRLRPQKSEGSPPLSRAVPRKEMIQRSKQIYENLPEVRRRKEEAKRRSEYQSYRLNAQLYNKWITNRVLGKKSAWS